MKVFWSKEAKKSLDNYCAFIGSESTKASKKVRKEIVSATKILSDNPYVYQIDEYYSNNNGDVRRFFRWQYRVVYQVQADRVLIINIYHTKKQPSGT